MNENEKAICFQSFDGYYEIFIEFSKRIMKFECVRIIPLEV